MSQVKSLSLALAGLAVLAAALAVGASGAGGSFVENDVRVLHEFDSDGPSPGGSYFGWAVSELGDVDGDGVREAIVGEPSNGDDAATGSTYVYSGRTGRLIYRFDGAPGDQNGFSMADAGDTNRDGVHDILVGSPGSPGNGPGHVDLYSGRTGALLHRFVGGAAGDAFGWSVSSAGDVDRDHHADVLVGAAQAFGAVGPGYATIYSGRTYEPIRTMVGDGVGNQFGSGAGWSRDVNRDHVPDQIIGARHAGAGRRGQAYVDAGRTGARLYTIDAAPNGGELGSFSWPASATSTGTARPTSTPATTRTRPTAAWTATRPAAQASTRAATATRSTPGSATLLTPASAPGEAPATSTATAARI